MKKPSIMNQGGTFSRFARLIAFNAGRPSAFAGAFFIIVGWATLGPYFGFSDTWQLVINTGTTIITFLMVFLIQNTQNHDSQGIQLKLNELIRAVERAHTAVIDSEELSDDELLAMKAAYAEIARIGRRRLREGQSDTGEPEVNFILKDETIHNRPNG